MKILFAKTSHLSIRAKTFASIISITILVLILFDSLVIYYSGKILQQNARSELEVQSMTLAQMVDDFLSTAQDNLETFSAHRIVMLTINDPVRSDFSQIDKHLEYRKELQRNFSELAVLDISGNCLSATDEDWKNRNFSDEDLFREGKSAYTLGPIFDSPEDGKIQLAAAPILSGKRLMGVVIGRLNVSVLISRLEKQLDRSTASEIFLIDQDLRFITSGRSGPSDLIVSHLANIADFSQKIKKNPLWSGKYQNFKEEPVLGSVAKIPNSKWWLAVETDFDKIVLEHNRIIFFLLMASILLLAIAFIMGYFLSRSITNPLAELSAATQKISDGNMDDPVIISTSSQEISIVGKELDGMRIQLQKHQRELIEKLNSSENKRAAGERLAAIGTMSAGLAHEIRNPLNSISLLVTQMKLTTAAPESIETLRLLESEIARLGKLVTNILEFARQIKPDYQVVNLRTVLNEMEALCSETLRLKNILLEVDCGGDTTIQCDRNMIKQALLNLLQNSIEAIEIKYPIRGGQLQIKAQVKNNFISLKVIDNGIGFDPASQEKMFDLFFTTKVKGNGFGLSEVLKITKTHKGTVDIYPQSPSGSIVDLLLPISQI